MSIITKEVLAAIENLGEFKFSPTNYANTIQIYEKEISLLKLELADVEEFMDSELYPLANNTVKLLLVRRFDEIKRKLVINEIEIAKYFAWIDECLDKHTQSV